MSERALCSRRVTTTPTLQRGVRELSPKKRERAIRRGNPDRPWGCWEVAFRSLARGGYAARTDFPRSLAMAWRSI
jgi:hypothetical protein